MKNGAIYQFKRVVSWLISQLSKALKSGKIAVHAI